MKCKICNSEAREKFEAVILNNYKIKYYQCWQCDFLQTEEPYWFNEAYACPINITDTGYLQRNIHLSKILTILLSFFFNPKGKFVDYAGGYGVFVRLMRDLGFDFYWDDKYTENLFASGFEWQNQRRVEAVTTFESFEHFTDPMAGIGEMLSISRNIIFTTEILPNPIPKPDEWWYYGLEHGQHISFYSSKTMRYMADYFRLRYLHLGNLYLLTEKENISNFKLKLLMLNKFGLHKLLSYQLKSKTWEDHLNLKIKEEIKNNDKLFR